MELDNMREETLSSGFDGQDVEECKDGSPMIVRESFVNFIREHDFTSPELYMCAWVFVFDVGQGNFILLRHQNTSILVDTGSSSKMQRYSYISNLFEVFVSDAEIKAIITTHPDLDYYNFLKETWIKNHFSTNVVVYIGGMIDQIRVILEHCAFKRIFIRTPGSVIDQQWAMVWSHINETY